MKHINLSCLCDMYNECSLYGQKYPDGVIFFISKDKYEAYYTNTGSSKFLDISLVIDTKLEIDECYWTDKQTRRDKKLTELGIK